MYTLKQKAQLYHQLFAAGKTGLPLQVALGPDLLPPAFRQQSALLLRLLDKGRPLSAVLTAAKLIDPWEARLLAVGESAGTLEQALGDLETYFQERQQHFATIRTKLAYPFVVFVILSLVGPVPALFRGELSMSGYAGMLLVKSVVVWLLYRLLIAGPFTGATGGAFNPLLLRCSQWVGSDHWLRQLFEISYLNLVARCLSGGIDAMETLRLMKDAVPDPGLRRRHSAAISQIGRHGVSLTQALVGSGLVSNPQIIGFLNASEQSGQLHSDLRQYLQRRRGELAALINHKLTQYGRLLYFVMLLAGLVR